MKRNNKKIRTVAYRFVSILLAVVSIIFVSMMFYVDFLPYKYMRTFLIVILIFDLFNISFINMKRLKQKVKNTLCLFMVSASFIMIIANVYLGNTLKVLILNGDSKYKIANYSIIVLQDSKYNKISNIKKEKIGFLKNSESIEAAKKKVLDKIDVTFESYDSSTTLIDDLMHSKINVIILEDSIIDIMKEESDDFLNSIKVIYKFKIKIKTELTTKDVNVTKSPFAIYISGIDTYGEISSVSRSDVNIVMIVNPKNHQVLLISIPRDYYVQLHGIKGAKDKLTHAGIYGIDMSIKTIEDLLEMDINYYVKVNFTSVIDIVDALGGLDVYSEYTFISYSDFKFKEGMNYVNGEQALDFARTRKAFKDGDRQRGKNQQAVIEALIRKSTSKSIITKYNSLLNAINGKYQTNMSMKKITSLIKMQLNDMSPWTVSSYSLNGYDSKDYTYTYNQLLYVMKPNEDSVQEAIELIKEILNDGKLENSYNNIGSDKNSNKVTKVYNNTNIDNNSDDKIEQKTDNEINKKEVDNSNGSESLKEIKQEQEDLTTKDDPVEQIIPQPSSDNLEEDDEEAE